MKVVVAVSLLLVLVAVRSATGYDPSPNPKAVVQAGKARFTVLTEHLVRMEWGGANDAATFAFVNRNLPIPKFTTSKDGNWTVIQTSAVEVRYLSTSEVSFNSDNLEVSLQLNGQTVTWKPTPAIQDSLGGNLKGTIRTLDGDNGVIELDCYRQIRSDLHCTLGLVSQSGYVVVDDTNRPQFDTTPWPWVVSKTYPTPGQDQCSGVKKEERQQCGYLAISQFDCNGMGCCYDESSSTNISQRCYYTSDSYRDLYFFGQGHDYKLALKEFTMVGGQIPLPPRYAFGIFYSRYWAYDDIGQMKVVRDYQQHNIPLDVLVTDMDWHITFYSQNTRDQAGQRMGWTGFTWDKHLFPNPKMFLDWCKAKGLKNTLNLHPASGIQPWEDKYEEMANAMGIDPSTKKYVPFVPTDKKFVTNWFEIVLGAREAEGIDFWWLDWQQGEGWIKIPLVNPTIWLNHIFFTDPSHWKNNTVRPFLLHRWGGLGNHRYQVGFSGDVFPSWASLDYQVTFTITASNVGFGYWSHDIGGHLAPPPPELYTRWVQWGSLSPIFRTHCTKNADNDRRIWVYPTENYEIMKQFIVLRSSLIPYSYSNARTAYDEGLSLLRPMYYEFPESAEAYTYDKQYFYGPDLLVAPITTPMDTDTNLTNKSVWIPKTVRGSYISWFSGEMFAGDQVLSRNYTLFEMPVFVKSGSIIPMRTDDFKPLGSAEEIPKSLKLVVFVGDAQVGETELYEDDGNTTQYMNGEYAKTVFSFGHLSTTANVLSVTIHPVQTSQYDGQPASRCYQICLPNFWPADNVTISGSNENLPYTPLMDSFNEYVRDSWTYHGSTLSLIINLVTERPVDKEVEVVINYSSFKNFDPYGFPGFAGMLTRLQRMKELLDDQWGIDTVYQDQYPSLLYATETGRMITAQPNLVTAGIMDQFKANLTNGVDEVRNLTKLDSGIKNQVIATLQVQS